MQKQTFRKPLLIFALFFAIAVLLWVFGLFPTVVLAVYTEGAYPIISATLRWISSFFPFALGDLMYVVLIIFFLVKIFLFLKKLKNKQLKRNDCLLIPLQLATVLVIFHLTFQLLWGLNYARPSISKELNISNDKYTVKQLVLLGNFFIQRLDTLYPKTNPKPTYTLAQLSLKAIANYRSMEMKNAFFAYPIPSVKAVTTGWMVSNMGIEGYYNPFSGEANVNMQLPGWVLPFVTCHEIAHQLGVAREDEANLTAYLVGINSKDIDFQYSVNYNMLRYILLEIRIKSPEDYLAMRNKISPGVLAQFKAENEFWQKYNGQMSNYMGVAFDKILKLNNQKRGIKSYQNIVIWLWNIHKGQIMKP
jgi:hypothetical protein